MNASILYNVKIPSNLRSDICFREKLVREKETETIRDLQNIWLHIRKRHENRFGTH